MIAVKNGRTFNISWTTVGPKHDPYSREFVETVIGENRVAFIACSLAGDGVRINGSTVWDHQIGEGNSSLLFSQITGVQVKDVWDALEEQEEQVWPAY